MGHHLSLAALFVATTFLAERECQGRKFIRKEISFAQVRAVQKSTAICTVERFLRIKRRMSMKDVIKLCGRPDRDIGSGIHIYVYQLADNSEVRVGTPDDHKLMYVVHVLPDGKKHDLLRSD